ncbi:MAG: archaetidylserine decarboxylase [Pseudomonadota bacterium]
MLDYLKTLPQYFLPQHLLSRLMYAFTRCRVRVWKDAQIRWFIRHYQVDMSIAQEPDARRYPDFNSFFTRALAASARPLVNEPGAILCPVDGTVSQIGDISAGRIFQAKGHEYSLVQLLGSSPRRAAPFENGRYATLYLSPKDYHRIHMPLAGRLREMVYVPGRLFSVNACTTRVVPRVFARNERVVCIFDTEAGPMAIVMVGALFVASMETVWAGAVTPPFGRSIVTWDYSGDSEPLELARGAELGRFNMGSTVIVLFGARHTAWNPALTPDATVRMGQLLGRIV